MNAYDRRTFVKQSAMLAGAAVAGCLLPASAFAQTLPAQEPPHPFFKNMNKPEVIAHRGGAGQWPEETLYALRKAVEIGVDILEVDVRGTCDNQLVLMHDPAVKRTTGGKGDVEDYRFDKSSVGKAEGCKDDARLIRDPVTGLDAGYGWPYCGDSYPFRGRKLPVPTLREVLDEFKTWTNTRMIIEVKHLKPSIVEPFCKLLNEYPDLKERVLVASFYESVLDGVRCMCEGVATSIAACKSIKRAGEISDKGWLTLGGKIVPCKLAKLLEHMRSRTKFECPEAARRKPEAIQAPYSFIAEDKEFVRRAHDELKMKVHVWTINDAPKMLEMIKAGVDGIITDYPGPLLELLGRTRK